MSAVSPELIRLRAYELWEAEGRPSGRDRDHWLHAAHELGALAKPSARRSRPLRASKAAPSKRSKAN